MGLFGFIGKAIGGIAKAVGGVAKVAAPFLPGPAGTIAKVVGNVLQVKHGASPKVVTGGNPTVMRGRLPIPPSILRRAYPGPGGIGYRPPPTVLRSSPVMPGGAVASPQGIMAPGGGLPPEGYGGGRGSLLWRQQGGLASTFRRKRKSTSTAKRSSKSRKKSTGRKLKFGSPAWRKKYMRKSRKRRAA